VAVADHVLYVLISARMCLCRSMSKTTTMSLLSQRSTCTRQTQMWNCNHWTHMLKVRRGQRECVWNSRKLGCGPSRAQGTVWHLLLSMLQRLTHSAGALAKIVFSFFLVLIHNPFPQHQSTINKSWWLNVWRWPWLIACNVC